MQEVFPEAILSRGLAYQKKGHVLSVRLSDGLLKARIKGSTSQIYDLHIDLKQWPTIPSRCSCTYHTHCKHAAACLLELADRSEQGLALPAVKRNDWFPDTVYQPTVEEEVIEADSLEWYSEVTEGHHDFFSYELGILIEGKPVSIVPLVVDLLRTVQLESLERFADEKRLQLRLAEGKVLQIAWGRIKPLLRLVLQYWKRAVLTGPTLEVKRYQLMLMHEAELALAASLARFRGSVAIQQQLQQLTTRELLPVMVIPKGLHTQLRDYQHQGFNWLQGLRESHFGGVLADDMGLGKTIQTLVHLQYEKEQGRLQKASLIVAPTSLVWNWFDEALRFTPDLKVLVFHGSDRHRDAFDEYDLVISTYGLIQRDKARFLSYPFYYVILDEAQSIKNARTKTTQIVQQLQGEHRLCLTGTPLENHLGELWSLFHFLMPGLLGDPKQFRHHFRIPIEKEGNLEKRALLIRRISPFMLRRTKNQVAQELPPKTDMTRMLELSGAQRDLYEAIRISMEKKVRDAIARQGLGKSQMILLDALLKLRQACCDPRLVSLQEAKMAHGTSVKLASLMELLDSLMEEGRHVLVFSQFTTMLALIEEALLARQYTYLKLTGQTTNRKAVVEAFQAGVAPIFLISLKAGGTGLNLTRADTVIHYDPWWNPAVEDQATDRSHRIGQENPVFVYKLITVGTVEEAILSMQSKKRQLFDGILSTHSNENHRVTEEDIARFFAPLP